MNDGRRPEGTDGTAEPSEGAEASPKSRVVTRPYRPEDRPRTMEIVRAVYGDAYVQTFDKIWDWEFLENPFAPAGLPKCLLIESKGTVVGIFGTLYAPLKLGSQTHTIAWLVGFMTHPEYRGAGGARHVLMARRLLTAIPLLLGNPGKHIVRFWKHFGASEMSTLPIRVRPLGLGVLLKGKLPGALSGLADSASRVALRVAYAGLDAWSWLGAKLAGVAVEEVSSFPPEVDDLWKRASVTYTNLVIRDKAYLSWRYERCPLGPYSILIARRRGTIAGYAVLRVFDAPRMRKGTIVDLFAPQGETAVAALLVLASLRVFRRAKAALVYALQSHPWLGRVFGRLGFFDRSSDPVLGTRVFMGTPSPGFELDRESFDKSDNWFLSFGDVDQDLVHHLM